MYNYKNYTKVDMVNNYISKDIKYIGVDDLDLDLFESQYKISNGVTYNSYVILDEKVAVLDTVDKRKSNEWLKNLKDVLNGRDVDYLIISHLEPDHSANIKVLCDLYPNSKIVLTKKALDMLPQFFGIDNLLDRAYVVKEGDTLNLGKHSLSFIMAPMVHWPEVMLEYETTEKILFSADAFGKFGVEDDLWDIEARRYYINIVGKYGSPVQALLKKASNLDIKTICPLHGPILNDNLGHYLDLYNKWSSYTPEEDGVLIVSASMHGNTLEASKRAYELLKNKGVKVELIDITRADMAEAVGLAFKYSKMILACSTYDGGIFSPMEDFLNRLDHKSYQNRTVALIENGSWAPLAAKVMKEYLLKMKNIEIIDKVVTIRTKLNDNSLNDLKELIEKF